MTNEELAVAIKDGQTELYAELWENVRKFVAYMAVNRYRHVPDPSAVDIDDLLQSGYIALVAAVNAFDGEHKFITYFALHLKRAFNDACGCGYDRPANDPIHHALSLDAPISEEDGPTLGEMQAVEDSTVAVDEKVFNEQLRRQINRLLSRLSPFAADIIRSSYFEGEPLKSIAERYNASPKRICSRRNNYLQQLRAAVRSTPEGKRLQAFLDNETDFYYHVGKKTFSRTHESAPEHLVLLRERLARSWRDNQ